MTEQLKDVNDTNHSGNNQPLLTVQITNESNGYIFSQETINCISSLGHTLKRIRRRLLDSGEFEIVNRRLVKKIK